MFGGGIRKLRGPAVLLGTASTVLAIVIPVPLGAGILPPPWPDVPAWWPDDGSVPGAIGDLRQFIDTLQRSLERLRQWAQLFQQTTSSILVRIVRESPGHLPDEADLTSLIEQIRILPKTVRETLEVLRNKLQVPVAPGSIEERHHAYIESHPAMVHEAVGITETDQVVAGGTVQQAVASQATAAGAAAVSRDLRPESVSAAAQETSRALTSTARDLPSSRAGIELLVAGMGAGLQQQANLGSATADRLTVLVQQTAQVSQQVGALAATTGALTLRQAERDRRALNGQLGLADAVSTAARLLQEILTGAGDPAVAEPRLEPLY
jgi:hypothetical protein